ncbi:MAG: hypothetical protein WAX04_04095, partial [Oscillospiraceae bacterium]
MNSSGSQAADINRIDSGLYLHQTGRVKALAGHWHHTVVFKLVKAEDLTWVNIPLCPNTAARPTQPNFLFELCKSHAYILDWINSMHMGSLRRLHHSLLAMNSLIPEVIIPPNYFRTKRFSLLGGFLSSVFGFATSDQVDRLAQNIDILTKNEHKMVEGIVLQEKNLASMSKATNARIDNVLEMLKLQQHIMTQTNIDTNHKFEDAVKILAALLHTSIKSVHNYVAIQSEFDNLLSALEVLNSGRLPSYIVSPTQLNDIFNMVESEILNRFLPYRLMSRDHVYYYKHADAKLIKANDTIFVNFRLPLVSTISEQDYFRYKIQTFPVPFPGKQNFTSRIMNMPNEIFVSNDFSYFAHSDDAECWSEELLCKFNKLQRIDSQNCLSALILNNASAIHETCKYNMEMSTVQAAVIILDHPLIMLQHVKAFNLNCPGNNVTEIQGCEFCTYNIPDNCGMVTDQLYIPPAVYDGAMKQIKHSEFLYPVNMGVLRNFFNSSELSEISGIMKHPVAVTLPQIKIFDHEFQERLAVDSQLTVDLKRASQLVKHDEHVFSNLLEPLITGQIFLENNWFFTTPGIIVLVNSSCAIVLLCLLAIIGIKLRTLTIVVAVLKSHKVQADPIVPELKYLLPSTATPLSDNIANFVTSMADTNRILIVLILMCIIVFFLRKMILWIYVKYFALTFIEPTALALEIATA